MAAEEEFPERWREERKSVMAAVEIDLGGARLEATALDMSLSGISVWVPRGVKPSSEVTIMITLDDRGPVALSARLAREYESDDGVVWGLAFGYVPPEVAARIETFLESR